MPITASDMATERYAIEAYEFYRNFLYERYGPAAAAVAAAEWEREWARCRPVRPEMMRGEKRVPKREDR